MATHEIERWSPFKVWIYGLFNRNPESNLAIIGHLRLGGEDRFLDIGCGLGAALEHAATTGAAVAGVDPSPAMVEKASARVPDADVRVGSAEAIPFEAGSFTVVINVASFHHWAYPEAGLKEILRVLAPGGRLHIVEGKLKRKTGHGLTETGARDLASTLTDLGFVDTAVTDLDVGRHGHLVVSATVPG